MKKVRALLQDAGRVAPPCARSALPFRSPGLGRFCTRLPDILLDPPVGARVLVPLGKRVLTGIVCGVEIDGAAVPSVDEGSVDLKPVVDVLDREPFLPAESCVWRIGCPSTTPAASATPSPPPCLLGRGCRASGARGSRISARRTCSGSAVPGAMFWTR